VPGSGPPVFITGREGSAEDARRKNLVILRKPVVGLTDTALARFIVRASRASKLKGTVDVLVTSSSELRSLNRRFRSKDQPTDVLSFPPGPGFANKLAGDIAISADIARENARKLGHPLADEIKILALHGVLHLVGYDHESDDGAMARSEAALRKSLGLPAGLIERNVGISKKTGRPKSKAVGIRANRAVRTR
jgi:probable rRNA maturation factor